MPTSTSARNAERWRLWSLVLLLYLPALPVCAQAQPPEEEAGAAIIEADDDEEEAVIIEADDEEAGEGAAIIEADDEEEGAAIIEADDEPEAAETPAEEVPPAEGEEATGVLTRAPELTTFVEADYPPEALEARQSASVVLLLTIEADGQVVEVAIQESGGEAFDASAMAAAKQFVFSPAEIDGQPSAVQILYRYNFEPAVEVEEKPVERATGVVEGRLLEKGTGEALVGVQVTLEGFELEAFTDEQGAFEFPEVPEGEIRLIIDEPGYASVADEETVKAGEAVSVEYYLERVEFTGDTIVIVGKRPKKVVARRTLSVEEIRTLPGTSGDALRVVQNLPGAARIPFGAGDLILRGGGLTQAYLNDMPILQAFHFGGVRSTVSSGLIEDVDVYPGNFSPKYGRLNGGVVNVRLRRPKTDGVHGFVEADVFDAGTLVEGPLGEHGALAVGFRRSYIDGILAFVLPDDAGTTLRTAPRWYDGQILYDHQQGKHRWRTLAFISDDKLVAVIKEPPENNPRIRGNARFDVGYWGVQSDYTWTHSKGFENAIGVQYLKQSVIAGVGQDFRLDFQVNEVTFREEARWTFTDTLKLSVGADVFTSFGEIFARGDGGPPKEGDDPGADDRDTIRQTAADFVFFTPAVWSQLEWTLGRLQVLPGFRVDYFGQTEDIALQPRLTSRFTLRKGTVIKGGVGLFYQAPLPDETDEVFGNPDLTLERSLSYDLGFEQQLTELISLDITGFFKDFNNLVRRADDVELQYTNGGIGRSYGMEVLLRHDASERFYGWLAYTLQRSERKDRESDPYRPFDFDQTHNVVLIGQYKLTPTWQVGMRWRYTTGNPTTPIVDSIYDSVQDQYIPVGGRVNSDRLEPFHQLDIRVDKRWNYDTWRLNAYLEFQNLYNRKNPEGVDYNYDFSESEIIGGLPIIPSLGIRGEF